MFKKKAAIKEIITPQGILLENDMHALLDELKSRIPNNKAILTIELDKQNNIRVKKVGIEHEITATGLLENAKNLIFFGLYEDVIAED